MRSRLAPLRELRGPRETLLFAAICGFAGAVPLLMRLPLTRVARLLGRPVRGSSPTPVAVERLATLTSLAVRVGHPVVRAGCLSRGLTLLWLLRRRGLDVELCFGLEHASPAGEGHCWLVLDGEPLLERVDPRARFVEQYRIGRPG